MILHPGILALLFGSAVSFSLVLYAVLLAIHLLRLWDHESSSEEQLLLERKTYLVTTVMKMVFFFSLVSGLLFLHTVDDIHVFFVGAMCATGTLNANPVGWWILLSKILIFFTAALWLVINTLDENCTDAPLVRLKYGVLPLLALLFGVDLYLQAFYFIGLDPQKITSCCGSLFASDSEHVASELAGAPPRLMMWIFYSMSCVYMLTFLFSLKKKWKWLRNMLFAEALILLPVSLLAIISFISLYIYQMPTHHCPFDMIQNNYHYIGYPLYIGLFGGILFGLVPGVVQYLPSSASLQHQAQLREKRWITSGMFLYGLFLSIAVGYVLFSDVMFFNY